MNRVGVPPHLTRGNPAAHVALDPLEHDGARPVALEPRQVQPEFSCIAAKILVLERLLAVEEDLVHVPIAALHRRGLRRARGGQRVRVNRRQREVPERKADLEAPLEALDHAICLARVRAFVVAVFEDQSRRTGSSDVVYRLVERGEPLRLFTRRAKRHLTRRGALHVHSSPSYSIHHDRR